MYKIAIIGAGSIGAMKGSKFDAPGSENVLTHAHAFADREDAKIFWMIDKDPNKAIAAALKWGGTAFDDIQKGFEYFINERPDIVVVATPTETHLQTLIQVLLYRPKLVIAEKPFCEDLWEAKMVSKLYREAGVPILVNYTRRFVPEIRRLREVLAKETVRWATVKYTRGFVREGCHAIDLCNMLFGYFQSGRIVTRAIELTDYGPDDPTYAAELRYSGCPHMFFCPSSGKDYNIFEVEICTNRTVITLTDNGNLLAERGLNDSEYGSYKTVTWHSPLAQETKLHQGLSLMVENAIRFLDGGTPIGCTDKDALAVHEVYDKLFRRMANEK